MSENSTPSVVLPNDRDKRRAVRQALPDHINSWENILANEMKAPTPGRHHEIVARQTLRVAAGKRLLRRNHCIVETLPAAQGTASHVVANTTNYMRMLVRSLTPTAPTSS